MVEKGEIMTCTYKTIGGISPFPTIFCHFNFVARFLVPKDRYWQMVEKGEISHLSYKTIGGLSPFPTILGVSHPDVVGID